MNENEKGLYLLLDSWSNPLAKGMLRTEQSVRPMRVAVMDGRVDDVESHEIVQLVSMDTDERPLKCHLLRSCYDDVLLEPLEVLDPELRRNLRIPVCFDSFRYPADGSLQKQIPIRSVDLSCGGIAFYSTRGLAVGDHIEVVIPVTVQPLIVPAEILRVNELKEKTLYAAKFIDLCHDEEMLIRRAVFRVQITRHRH